MKTNVFVSYASQDKEFAETVKRKLADLEHLPADTVFLDAQDIPIGENIRERLKSQIRASDAVILVMTENSASSQWINYEAGLADALGKKILVVGKKGSGKTALLAYLAEYQHVELEALLLSCHANDAIVVSNMQEGV